MRWRSTCGLLLEYVETEENEYSDRPAYYKL